MGYVADKIRANTARRNGSARRPTTRKTHRPLLPGETEVMWVVYNGYPEGHTTEDLCLAVSEKHAVEQLASPEAVNTWAELFSPHS